MLTEDAAEAQKRFANFLLQTAGGTTIAAQPRSARLAPLTVTKALDDYLKEHVASRVIDQVRPENAARHLKAFFGSALLRHVDISSTREYAAARRSGRVGGGQKHYGNRRRACDSTIRRELTVLIAAANHAARWRRIAPNEMPSIEKPLEARREAPWLTKAELREVMATARGHLRNFILVAYYTAGRKTSVQSLTKRQVDLSNNTLNLSARGATTLERLSPKRRPVVPIDPALRPVIRRLLRGSPNSAWLFDEPRDMYRPFRQHMAALGLAHKGGPHVLRHTRATHLLQDGVSIYDVSRLLGDSVSTVDRTYGHHSADRLGLALRRKRRK